MTLQERQYKTLALMAGATCARCPADCPCKKTARGGLAGVEDGGDPGTDPAAGAPFDWHLLALAALACMTLYAIWPKPEREARNVSRREAAAAYQRRLRQIDSGRKKAA
jgi:hypothetical protein